MACFNEGRKQSSLVYIMNRDLWERVIHNLSKKGVIMKKAESLRTHTGNGGSQTEKSKVMARVP